MKRRDFIDTFGRGTAAAISIFIMSVLSGALGATPPALFTPSTRYLDEIFSDMLVTKDLVFGEAVLPNGERLKLRLNLYEPAGDKEIQRPAIVWIHGGGFFQGDKGDLPMSTLARCFSLRGYVTVSINYRLERKNLTDANIRRPVMDAMYDARAAVRWLRRNAAFYRIDENKIVIGGGSAGAFTALHVAYDSGEGDSGNPGPSSAVSAVVDFWGGLLDPGVMKPGAPPLLVIHGTADKTVPFSMAERLLQRAKEVGVICEFHPLEGKGHAAWEMMNEYIGWIAPFLYDNVINDRRR